MTFHQYNPVRVIGQWAPAAIAAVDIVEGRVQGEFMGVTKDNPNWTRESDGNGNNTRVKNNNRGGIVVITIAASSPTNNLLSAAVELDFELETIVGPLVIRDLSGTTTVRIANAFLEDTPTLGYSNARGERVWTFQCGEIRRFVGGHDVL